MGNVKNRRVMKANKIQSNKRSSYSGRLINNKDVILIEEAPEYLRKMGFTVITKGARFMTFMLAFMFVVLSAVFSIHTVSAYTPNSNYPVILQFDISSLPQIFISVGLLGLGIWLLIGGRKIIASTIYLLVGIEYLFSGVNPVLSFAIMLIGVTFMFVKGGNA